MANYKGSKTKRTSWQNDTRIQKMASSKVFAIAISGQSDFVQEFKMDSDISQTKQPTIINPQCCGQDLNLGQLFRAVNMEPKRHKGAKTATPWVVPENTLVVLHSFQKARGKAVVFLSVEVHVMKKGHVQKSLKSIESIYVHLLQYICCPGRFEHL